MPWAWPARGTANSPKAMAAAAKTSHIVRPAGIAAASFAFLVIFIPLEVDVDWRESETPVRPKGCVSVTNWRRRPSAREKVSARRRIAPCAALIAPWQALTLPSWSLEQWPDSGHIRCRGQRTAALQTGSEAKSKMRSFLTAFAGLMLFATTAAQANVAITVDKNAQIMTVAVDGVERYHSPVWTGIPSYETPNGSFRTFRMEEDHFSKEFDDAPMPHSIFFTKIGHA